VIDIVDEDGAESLKDKRVRLEKEQSDKDRAHPAFEHSLLKNAKLIEIRSTAPTSQTTDPLLNEG